MTAISDRIDTGFSEGGDAPSDLPDFGREFDEGVLPGAQGVTPSWGVRLGLGAFFTIFALLFLAKLYLFALHYREAIQSGAEPARQVMPATVHTP